VDLARLPKIDLHRHLEGSLRFDTFVELARDIGIDLSRRELRRRTSMKGEKPGFLTFLSKFELYRGLYPSRDWIERVALEAAQDARRDGVVYLELRFSPTHFGRRMGAAGEDVAEWVARGARRSGLDLRFIATYGRDFGPGGNTPTTRAVRGTNVFSGLDLAGNEAKSALPFLPLFRKLRLPVTIHAGEAGSAGNVRQAIEQFGSRRIGHGLRALGDPQVLELARRRGVHFELCPTSELQTGAAPSWKRHPAWEAPGLGVSCSLNTDDPSICGIRLSGEFDRARRAGWSPEGMAKSLDEAARASFQPPSAQRRLSRKIASSWAQASGKGSARG
jgi:adenosine deaminase